MSDVRSASNELGYIIRKSVASLANFPNHQIINEP